MDDNATLATTILSSAITSGLVFWVLDFFKESSRESKNKILQINHEVCDNFCNYIEQCQAKGCAFWSKSRADLSAELPYDILFLQDRAEGAYHRLSKLGYQNKNALINLFELLTGGTYDDDCREADPEISTQIAIICAEICTSVDEFKSGL